MSIDIAAIVERARIAAAEGRRTGEPTGEDREKLKVIAAEFEAMLLVQMLRDMRKAGSWADEDEGDGFGAETMFDMLDVELASHLARVQSMGLQEQMLEAFDRLQAPGSGSQAQGLLEAPASQVPGSGVQVPGSVPGSVPVSNTNVNTNANTNLNTNVDLGARTPERVAALKPVDGAVTSAFGWRRDPFTGRAKFHQGVDLRAAYGQEVQAAGAGRVVFSGEQGGYGTSVVIEHPDGTRTRYAHLSAALVAEGDEVAAGAIVGRAGQSGRATGTHLHFEVIGRDGRRLPPQLWARVDVQMTGKSGD